MFIKYMHGKETLEGQALANADLNSDNHINIVDLIFLKKAVTGETA